MKDFFNKPVSDPLYPIQASTKGFSELVDEFYQIFEGNLLRRALHHAELYKGNRRSIEPCEPVCKAVSASISKQTLKRYKMSQRGTSCANLYASAVQSDVGCKCRVAFTLAEVLITLTIIGVIAALTIPNLMSKYQEHAWHQQWKDDYAMLNNAYKMVVAEEPDIVVSAKNTYYMTPEFINAILSKLKVVETCGYNTTHMCDNYSWINQQRIKYKWSGIAELYSRYKTLAGGETYAYDFGRRAALLKNGASIYLGGEHSGYTIVVDVNNYTKGPNVLGKDVYALNLVEIKAPARAAWIKYSLEISANELMMQPYGAPNKQDGEGLKGCAADIGKQGDIIALYTAPGAGCSYKYLYEK